jgi:hypothetical protein
MVDITIVNGMLMDVDLWFMALYPSYYPIVLVMIDITLVNGC